MTLHTPASPAANPTTAKHPPTTHRHQWPTITATTLPLITTATLTLIAAITTAASAATTLTVNLQAVGCTTVPPNSDVHYQIIGQLSGDPCGGLAGIAVDLTTNFNYRFDPVNDKADPE